MSERAPRNRDIARRLAEESVVLLDNPENLLPLAAPHSIAVIGPTADDAHCLFGCYSFPNHVLPHHPDLPLGVAAQTVFDAVRAEFPDAAVRYEPGCAVNAQNKDGFPAAIEAARDADLTILVVGDRCGLFGRAVRARHLRRRLRRSHPRPTRRLSRTSRPSLRRLPQADPRPTLRPPLRDRPAHQDRRSHGPGVLPRLRGRRRDHRRAVRPRQPLGPAPGADSGRRVEPAQHLPGAAAGAQERWRQQHRPDPRLPFGHGLTYTTFTVTDVQPSTITEVHPSTTTIPLDGRVAIQATLTNTGSRPGVAVPQLYLSDPVATVTRPVRRLIGFTRVELAAGESSTVEFDVHADLTSFTGRDLARRVEPGHVVLTVAQSAADPGLSAHVALEGDVRVIDHTRTMHTPTTISAR